MANNIGSIRDDSNFKLELDGDIEIEEIVNSTATITSTSGGISIKNKIDNNSKVTLHAQTTITIGQKIDNGSEASLFATGDITIDQKIDNDSTAFVTSFEGGIFIGQKIDNGSSVGLECRTGVTINQKVDNGSNAVLTCKGPINIPQGVDNNAVVTFQAPSINCPISDHGQLLQLPLDSLVERARAAIRRIEAIKLRQRPPAR